ncbi:hypothetical protein B6U66_03075 [Candidatus Bathyarchaeota archaeon ex4484_135]|nr:MAG: hypothetical protein B6U66_03075 [Candidatus Bathyarchaeota archaeon ex4484_135]
MDEKAFELLNFISRRNAEISAYDLVEEYAEYKREEPQRIFNDIMRYLNYLAGFGFVRLESRKVDDTYETYVIITEEGKRYVEHRRMVP